MLTSDKLIEAIVMSRCFFDWASPDFDSEAILAVALEVDSAAKLFDNNLVTLGDRELIQHLLTVLNEVACLMRARGLLLSACVLHQITALDG